LSIWIFNVRVYGQIFTGVKPIKTFFSVFSERAECRTVTNSVTHCGSTTAIVYDKTIFSIRKTAFPSFFFYFTSNASIPVFVLLKSIGVYARFVFIVCYRRVLQWFTSSAGNDTLFVVSLVVDVV